MGSGSTVYANSFSEEATVNGTTDVTFPWRSRKVIILNDSGSGDLDVKMRINGPTTLTIRPGETLELFYRTLGVTLTTSESVIYRVWAFG